MREEITDCLRDVQNETRLHAQTSGPRSITQNPPAAARSVVEGNTSLGTETASQSATQLPEIATLASEQTTIAVPEDKKEGMLKSDNTGMCQRFWN